VAVSVAFAAAACTSGPGRGDGPPRPTRSPSVPAGPNQADLREDLTAIVDFLKQTHPDPWHHIGRAQFAGAVSALDERLGEALSSDAFLVEVMRLLALLGPGDGHTGVFPLEQDVSVLPLRLYRFSDGVFVVGAADGYQDLVGAEVRTIAGWPVRRVWAAIAPLVPADNQMTVLARAPQVMVVANVLHGLGITDDPTAPVDVGVSTAEGERSVAVDPVPAERFATMFDVWNPLIPPALPAREGAVSYAHADEDRYVETLHQERALYVGYHLTLGSTVALADAILDAVEGPNVDRVVLDLRFNPGGDNGTYAPLLDALRRPSVDRPGRLVVLLGRSTFSAAGNLATELDVSTSAVFLGERAGFRPDLYGDPATLVAPNTGVRVEVATRYWDFDGRGPHRPWLEPDVVVPLTSADYLGGTDPALDAALRLRPRK
jgi:hypothetical protein